MSTPKGVNADFWGDDEVGADLNRSAVQGTHTADF